VNPSVTRDTTSAADEAPVAADVYAGDIATLELPFNTRVTLFLFRIEADPEPDVLARVAGVFNVANIAPRRATLRRESPDMVNITVAIELAGAVTADMIRRKLEQLTCTLSVELVIGDSD
jgi:glycine cleavage system regulatory protein